MGFGKKYGNLVYDIWKDTKVVCTLSSIHKGHSDHTVKQRVKKNKKREDVRRYKSQFQTPM